jgi:hypothetical protein
MVWCVVVCMKAKPAVAPSRGQALNVYLSPPALARLRAFKKQWGCSWGKVIERLMDEARKPR